ncbi:MAG: glycoside hydrolase family 65 protein [Alkalibacterium sp.]|nr:glycoside hydrolase family 65 protein [Alkalibacterium sp.]
MTENDVHQQIADKKRDSLSLHSKADESIVIDRFVAYSDLFKEASLKDEVTDELVRTLKTVSQYGYEELLSKHIQKMASFWDKSDIQIEGEQALQLGLRFNLFHLHQAAGRDGKTNMSAKGLTGEGYEGHYFWDTEMYMFPFFLYTQPDIARSLLMYRYSILPQARERARTMAIDKGALFAWRTINGEEASPYYPAGTAQIHINADIAHAIYSYGEVTGDSAFMLKEGVEMLVETARFWMEWGHFDDERNEAFVINDVTGPDEYTAIVNNNYYTNLMAKKNLTYAIEWVEKSGDQSTGDNLNVSADELAGWKKAAEKMFLPYDKDKQLTMQDDSFFHKKVWDFDQTPKENYPLLLNYHPLTIYKHQVCKQADTVLGQFLFLDDFSLEQKKRDYAYYEKVTTHDSSLSRSVFGMMASQIGEDKKAYDYFMDTALMDITDLQSNTRDGVHAANMGGTWMSMVQGFAGLRVSEGTLHSSPHCPLKWDRVAFKVSFKKRLIEISMTPSSTDYTLLEGESLTIIENGKEITL